MTLTAKDSEPAVGSVVLDSDGVAWQHVYSALRIDIDIPWQSATDCGSTWAGLFSHDYGPLTLIHDGANK